MLADIHITEKSYGDKSLMKNIKFSIDEGEKVGVVGRNGVGKSTLFGILTGSDTDFTGDIIYRRGAVVASTAQEHHGIGDKTVLQYVLEGLPEYSELSHIVETYPDTMGDDMRKIEEYTAALQRFDDKGFYQIEEKITRELDNFQLQGTAHRSLASLSGGQKRLIEIVKIMHSDAHLALIDEPTNHMDYVAKQQFIDWMAGAREAMLVITHDRDVLKEIDRIIELKGGECVSYKGNYDAYLKQNATSTAAGMNDFEQIEKRIVNLKQKVLDYQRLKEKSRNPGTIQKFKRLENESRTELAQLQAMEKPSFWIDKESAEKLDYKAAARYDKFKSKNIRMTIKNEESRSKHVLIKATDVALGYGDTVLFEGVNIDLREGEALELRGRNGAGKTTLIRAILQGRSAVRATPASQARSSLMPSGVDAPLPSLDFSIEKSARRSLSTGPAPLAATRAGVTRDTSFSEDSAFPAERVGERQLDQLAPSGSEEKDGARDTAGGYSSRNVLTFYSGEITLDPHARIGIYDQEIDETYLDDTLEVAIEKLYLAKGLPISDTKIRSLLSDYLFTEGDRATPLARLSGGQKARFQLISMLANDPQLLILDEPTNHLDLPSIEEIESALKKYTGAILYVSHDGYFRQALGGEVLQIGTEK
jgi:ATPase subunit of ABC transporter with duplicated ATPase domains